MNKLFCDKALLVNALINSESRMNYKHVSCEPKSDDTLT